MVTVLNCLLRLIQGPIKPDESQKAEVKQFLFSPWIPLLLVKAHHKKSSDM